MKPYKLRINTSEGFHAVHELEDPFHNTEICVAWSIRDWLKFLLRRELKVGIVLEASLPAVNRVMAALHDDCSKCGTGDKSFHMDHVGEHREQYVGGESNG